MRIRSLEVENFRRFHQKYAVSFLGNDGKPRPLTVIVGPNMSGKTTILDAIHLVHACVENLNEPRLRPEFDPNDPANRPDPNQPVRIKIEFSLDDGEWEELNRLESMLSGKGIDTPESPVYSVQFAHPAPMNSYHGVTSNDPWNASLAFRGRALAKLAMKRRVAPEGVFESIGTVLYLDQHRSVDLGVPSRRTGTEEALREQATSRDVLPWLELQSRLDEKWDPPLQGESAWSRIKRLFALLAAPAEIDDIKPFDEGFDLRLRNGVRYYYSAGMSSGERQALRFVTNLVAGHARRSVVLVDELELHLHPRWQREMLAFCRKGGGDSNQFIVTTHSESILRYADPAEVIILGDVVSE